MGQASVADVSEPTRRNVRAKVLEVLAHYASVGGWGPIPLGRLFQDICDGLVQEGTIPGRSDGAKFASLEYSHHTDSFPDFGVSADIGSLVRQVLWELYVQGILSPSPQAHKVLNIHKNYAGLLPLILQMDLDCAVLTTYGVEILADTSGRVKVHDPDRYLANFWKADPQPDREMMRYLDECVAVFRGGHFLATIVLLGVASERLIEVLAESLRDALGDPTGVDWFNTKYVNKRDISTRFSSLSGKLMGQYSKDLDGAKLKEAFTGVVTLTFEQIRCARNDIAHPMGREFTWNEVSGFLHSFVQYFIYVNRIVSLLESKRASA
jgi:hypothetical protein